MARESGLSRWRRRLGFWALGLKAHALERKIPLNLMDPSGWPRDAASASGQRIDDESAMRVSTVWACNKILAESIGMLPFAMFENDGAGNALKVTDHPVAELLTRTPNADMTDQEFREAGQLNLGLRGNAFALKEFGSRDRLVALHPIAAVNVDTLVSDEGIVSYKVRDRGKQEVFPREKIWHVKGFGGNGIVGLSVLSAARESMGIALSSEEFQARFFASGARPSAVATFPGWFNDDQRKAAHDKMNQLLGGLENAHKLHILEGGMKLEPWGMPLDDLQFLGLRQFSVPDICRFYRIPPHMVADLSRATFSNIEQQSLEFVQYTLMPWLVRWERSASRWLLSPADQRRFYFRFNVEGLLRADSSARQAFLAAMVQNGIMTRNEARGKENLGRSNADGMDDFTVQVNLSPISDLPGAAPPPSGEPNANA